MEDLSQISFVSGYFLEQPIEIRNKLKRLSKFDGQTRGNLRSIESYAKGKNDNSWWKDAYFIAAKLDDRFIGMISVYLPSPNGRYIKSVADVHFFVLSKYRNRGIARKLADQYINKLQQLNLQCVGLWPDYWPIYGIFKYFTDVAQNQGIKVRYY